MSERASDVNGVDTLKGKGGIFKTLRRPSAHRYRGLSPPGLTKEPHEHSYHACGLTYFPGSSLEIS